MPNAAAELPLDSDTADIDLDIGAESRGGYIPGVCSPPLCTNLPLSVMIGAITDVFSTMCNQLQLVSLHFTFQFTSPHFTSHKYL